jgi:hypothetical protein
MTSMIAMSRAALPWVLLFLGPSSGMGAAGDVTPAVQHLRAPEHISSQTRAELEARMSQHGETMSSLVRAVVLLDRPKIRVLAGRIADEEVIAQAGTSKQDRRPLSLPRELFAEQSKLSQAARALVAAAADEGDDRALAERFAAVTSTCVSCHSAYLHGRPDPGATGPKPR